MNPVTGIVLAGGKSSRMGKDKGLLPWNGKTLLEYAIDSFKPLCSEIIISSNQPGYDRFGYLVVEDVFKDVGPIGGIHAGLEASNTELNLLTTCDSPILDSSVYRKLLDCMEEENYDIVYAACERHTYPLTAIYRKSTLDMVVEQIQKRDYKVKNLLNLCKSKPVLLKQPIINVNTKLDFELL